MRRGLGRGRALVAIGSVLAVIGAFLPWTFAGGEMGLPVTTANAFDGAGILMFIAAVALLALLILPYASASGRSSLDRWVSFVLLAGLMVVGTLLQLVQLFSGGVLKLAARHSTCWACGWASWAPSWSCGAPREIVGQETMSRSADGPRQMTTFRPRRRK